MANKGDMPDLERGHLLPILLIAADLWTLSTSATSSQTELDGLQHF